MSAELRAPFPYFGGKSRIAAEVWARFGQIQNYVDPFCGSLAVPLLCPHPGHTETVNDLDGLLVNFWRALKADPDAVAALTDYPVSELDLHARHRYLVDRRAFIESMLADPDWYDVKVAAWWVWGISQWIGSGWCPRPPAGVTDVGELTRKLPHVGDAGRGVHRASAHAPDGPAPAANCGALPREGGRGRPSSVDGVHRAALSDEPWQQRPDLSSTGRGDAAPRLSEQLPYLNERNGGDSARSRIDGGALFSYFRQLATRVRRMRITHGDWMRVLGPSVTWRHGVTAVFLDPPYPREERADVYAAEGDVFAVVRAWAIEAGQRPDMRIALCGYAFEMPDGWKPLYWKAHGGYGSQGQGRGRANAAREVIWFSPNCIAPAALAKDALTRPLPARRDTDLGPMFTTEE